MTAAEIREQLRHDIFVNRDAIEDIVAAALMHIVVEATAYGAAEDHDFDVDRIAAKTADRIGNLLDGVVQHALDGDR